MARKNQLKRSKSEETIRKSRQHQRRKDLEECVNFNFDGEPPKSSVKTSEQIFINGSIKKLKRERDRKNLSNSAKTIRPNARPTSVPPTSNVNHATNPLTVSFDQSASDNDINPTDDSLESEVLDSSLINDLRSKLILGRYSLPTYLSSDNSFIRSPRDTKWYLDPIHRQKTVFNNEFSLRRSYIDDLGANRHHLSRSEALVDNDESLDMLLDKSSSFERTSLERLTKASPYELELCALRKEKLRLEESMLLKQKCEIELERTRSPKPKWYELKTPEFTVEMEKHNNVVNNSKYWNELHDYRSHLHEMSNELSSYR